MKHKIIISTISMMAVMPAFADIATNNATPTCDSTTIGATSGSTSLDAVWNIVNQTCTPGQYFDMTTATCVTCGANSYCPGGTYNVESQTNGLNSCPNGYGLSVAGADAQTDCYRTCTTNDVAHSTGVTGGYYYGANNQCGATGCAAGWHVKEGVGYSNYVPSNQSNSAYGYIDTNGLFSTGGSQIQHEQSYYGITQPNEWANDMGEIIRGRAVCSKTPGTNNNWTWSNSNTLESLTDETGQEGARYCYCQLTGIKPVGEKWQKISSAWVFHHDREYRTVCAQMCASSCARSIQYYDAFRRLFFNSLAPTPATCEANTINITWYNEGSVHDENTCTYAESVTLPETNPERTGYNFTGWTVRPATTE